MQRASANQRLLPVSRLWTEMCLRSRNVLMSRVHIAARRTAPFISIFFFFFLLPKMQPNSQRETHAVSWNTSKGNNIPVTCGDCRCGPPNPPGRTQGSTTGWFNYTRQIKHPHVCVCIAGTCFFYIASTSGTFSLYIYIWYMSKMGKAS